MAVDFHRTIELLRRFFSHGAIVAEMFDFEKTSVGLKADLPQSGQVTQPLPDIEVAGVVDGGLGAHSDFGDLRNLFEVLLDARALVIDVEGSDHAFGDYAGAENSGCSPSVAPVEDELNLVGTTQIEVFADDLFEKNAGRSGGGPGSG